MNRCIYLNKDESEVTFDSREHIFPASIGGIKTLPADYVSKDCNNAFSKLELDFVRKSIISIPRQFYGPGKRGKLAERFATESGIIVMEEDINLDFKSLGYIKLGVPHTIPQISLNFVGTTRLIIENDSSDYKNKISSFLESLSEFNGDYTLVTDDRIGKNEILFGVHRNKWYLALSNKELAERLKEYIPQLLDSRNVLSKRAIKHTSYLSYEQSVEFSDVHFRMCAKIMLNYLSYIMGREFVGLSCFDPLKNWILNGGENQFGKLIPEIIGGIVEYPEYSHVLIITKTKNSLVGHISFYGGSFQTLITLCDNFLQNFMVEGYICDWKNRREFKLTDWIDYHSE